MSCIAGQAARCNGATGLHGYDFRMWDWLSHFNNTAQQIRVADCHFSLYVATAKIVTEKNLLRISLYIMAKSWDFLYLLLSTLRNIGCWLSTGGVK